MSSAESLLINKILNDALEKRASDIHLTVGNYPVLRINGALVMMTEEQILTPDFVSAMSQTFLSEADQQRLQHDREVTVAYTWADRARFRAQVFYQKGYLAISLRLIPQLLPAPKDLGLSSVVINAAEQPRGLILVVGPYHSGRTTTVFSLVESINQRLGKRIVTLERPIEYILINNKAIINQREVGKDSPTFNDGMREMIDDDADIVVVGQVTESGQEEEMLNLVESGKLVMAVANGQSVISALESFISSFSPSKLIWAKEILSNNLLVATAQRLVPKNSGGLALAYEILTINPAVKNVLKDGNFYQLGNIMLTSRQDGMIALDRHLSDLVKAGQISQEQAIRFAVDSKGIASMFSK